VAKGVLFCGEIRGNEALMLKLLNDTNTFYDAIADAYHLFYRDWDAAMQREGSALRRLFRDANVTKVLDASCGTGTQAIAMAQHHFEVTAADPSQSMLLKAQEHAKKYKAADDITFVCTDFLNLTKAIVGPFDAVITKGNSLPHLLTDDEILQALRNFYALLRPGGMAVVGMRDYDLMVEDRPRFVPRQLHTEDPNSDFILFDVWDWDDGPPVTVTFNTFIVSGKGQNYSVSKHVVTYRALLRSELESLLIQAGFVDVKFEPQGWEVLVTAKRPA
jgi:glycine/sarcosine N-methyltransferase